MPRLLSPGDKCVGVDMAGSGRRYDGKILEVSDNRDVRDLRAAGYTLADASGGPSKAPGFECLSCGFKSFFRLCSRCGDDCDRPDLVA